MQETVKTDGLGSQLTCLLKDRKPTPSCASINGNRNHMSLLSKGPVASALLGSGADFLTQARALCAFCSIQVLLKCCHRMHSYQVEHCHVKENCYYFSYSKIITSHRTYLNLRCYYSFGFP